MQRLIAVVQKRGDDQFYAVRSLDTIRGAVLTRIVWCCKPSKRVREVMMAALEDGGLWHNVAPGQMPRL